MENNNIITFYRSFILTSDAYKETHHFMRPPETTHMYSYAESRGGILPYTVFEGLQIILLKHFVGQVVTQQKIDEADAFCYKVFGANYFNREGWQYILDKYDGYIPLTIKAVPEGTVVPTGNVLMTVENKDPKLEWLTNFAETILLHIWYSTTVCTVSYHTKLIIRKWAKLTGSEVSPFHLNDFGFRGVSSVESAGIGGQAHLANWLGTDNLEGVLYAMKYYGADVCGFSVPAAEHSTITVFGKNYEADAYEHLLDKFPTGILSIVLDSWDIYNAIINILGKKLKDKILARVGKVVVRPDSGDPVEVCLKVIQLLWDAFGGTVNKKGFKVLNPVVGILYGDGITYLMIDKICEALHDNGWAIENVIFGQGGGLLQQWDRDTFKFAFKVSQAVVGGLPRDVYKTPITDMGKSSKRGRLKLIRNNGTYTTVCQTSYEEDDELVTVFENGKMLKEYTFDEIRNWIRKQSENHNFFSEIVK